MTAKQHLHTLSYWPKMYGGRPKGHANAAQVFSSGWQGPASGQTGISAADTLVPVPYFAFEVYGLLIQVLTGDYPNEPSDHTVKVAALLPYGAAYGPTVSTGIIEPQNWTLGTGFTLDNCISTAGGYTNQYAIWLSTRQNASGYVNDVDGWVTDDNFRLVNDQSSDGNGSDDIPYYRVFCDQFIAGRSDAGNYNTTNTPVTLGASLESDGSGYSNQAMCVHMLVEPWDGIEL